MTDIASLAQQAITYLSPFLPSAAIVVDHVTDGFLSEPGAKLYDWLANKFKGTQSESTLDRAIAEPANPRRVHALQLEIEDLAEKDPEFRHQLTQLLKEIAQTAVTAPQTVKIKGDNNKTALAAGSNINIHIG